MGQNKIETQSQLPTSSTALNGAAQVDNLSKQVQDASKNKSKKGKPKKQRRKKKNNRIDLKIGDESPKQQKKGGDDDLDVEIEYVPEALLLEDENFEHFSKVFEHFNAIGVDEDEENEEASEDKAADSNEEGAGKGGSDMDSDDSDNDEGTLMSKKKLKQQSRMSVAELKKQVQKPEAVEWVDVTASDPKLLVSLKSIRNSVPVPQHWSQKRKFLQNKRGIEKPPFKLPDFIRDTGIMEMREAVKEKEDAQTAKARMRERVQPKMNKLTIDYQRLHDAFFRFQQAPSNLTNHGEIYYEGKEFESDVKHAQPGVISEELREALNIPPLAPPPWLTGMQRHGMPPSYPHLVIPGLNAPIPAGAQWGYHPGGWGRPPVNEHGQPLYGDVFGVAEQHQDALNAQLGTQNATSYDLWGELESGEEEESEEEESEEETDGDENENEEIEDKEDDTEAAAKELPDGLVTPGGLQSVPAGLETPDVIQLRKDRSSSEQEEKRELYQVLPERQTKIQGFMGSQHVYDISGAQPTQQSASASKSKTGDGVEIAIDPSEIADLDDEAIKAKYEAQMKAKADNLAGGTAHNEDMSDMVAEHAERQERKRKQQDQRQPGGSGRAKKSRDGFKF